MTKLEEFVKNCLETNANFTILSENGECLRCMQ